MANFNANDRISLDAFYFNNQNGNTYINTWQYRAVAGGTPEAPVAYDALAVAWQGTVYSAIQPAISSDVVLTGVRIRRLSPAIGFSLNIAVSPVVSGSGPAMGISAPQMCACIVRKTLSVGRKGIGRLFLPGLTQFYEDAGRLVLHPLLNPDITTVSGAVTLPVVVGGGDTWSPVVHGHDLLPAGPTDDVITGFFSPLVTFLHSRRPGRGI